MPYKITSEYGDNGIIHTYTSPATESNQPHGFFRDSLCAGIRDEHEDILKFHPKLKLTTIVEGVEAEVEDAMRILR